jgi:sugar lactone lactonase YvrE
MRRLVHTVVTLMLLSMLFLAFACSVPAGEEEAGVGSGPGFKAPLGIAVEADGSLVVTDIDLRAVVRVDPTSGDRTIISDNTTGTGPNLKVVWGIAVEADGSLVVTDSGLNALNATVRVDPVSGDRTIVSDNTTGSGPSFGQGPFGIAVEANGSLVVTDQDLEAVVRVDPASGNRTIVSDASRGSGPEFGAPTGIAVEANGGLVVVDNSLEAVVRVDPISGNRTIVSDASTGSGPSFEIPWDIAVEADGSLVVADRILKAVVRVDPVTGGRTIVSDNSTGSGPGFGGTWDRPDGIAVEADGSLVVTVPGLEAVLRVDPINGNRTIVSASSAS